MPPMPTLPMMTPTPHADASRQITAPGGYEWWRFDASSDDGKLHLIASLHVGHALDPRYLRRYAWYRRFPTKIAPPVPAEHCAATFALLEHGRPALRFAAPAVATADDFSTAADGRSVRLGASHMNRGPDGVLRLHLRGTYHDRTISVNLSFRPQIHANCTIDLAPPPSAPLPAAAQSSSPPPAASPLSSSSPSASAVGAHGWVVVDPLCDVDGEISVIAAESGGPPRVTPFAGSGAHDHRFGTRPLAALASRWLIGRALFEDRAIAFQQADDAAAVCRSVVGEQSPPRVMNGGVKTSGSGTTRWGIGYPETIELPRDVRLMRPRVVGSSPATVTVAYDAVGDLETGRALVQVLKPRRLLWAPR